MAEQTTNFTSHVIVIDVAVPRALEGLRADRTRALLLLVQRVVGLHRQAVLLLPCVPAHVVVVVRTVLPPPLLHVVRLAEGRAPVQRQRAIRNRAASHRDSPPGARPRSRRARWRRSRARARRSRSP